MAEARTNKTQTAYRDRFAGHPAISEREIWPWLTRIRRDAYERFQFLGFPSKAEEEWKHVPLETVLGASYVSEDKKTDASSDREIAKVLSFMGETPRLVFVNGSFSENLSQAAFMPHGVFLGCLSENVELTPDIVEPFLAKGLAQETNPFSLINTFSFKEGAFVYVPGGVMLSEPLQIYFISTPAKGGALALHPRLLLVLGKESKAEVIVRFVTVGESGHFNNFHADIYLEENAVLEYEAIQQESCHSVGFLTNRYHLKKESVLNGLSFSQGGKLVRRDDAVEFSGDHASVALKGLSVLSKEAQVYQNVVVHHSVPHCVSRQFYKNILTGRSKSEFNSLVHVDRLACGSDSHQLNKNLLLSGLAQSFARPQLRIDNEDVACRHGATVGQLEETELFYLRSRGLSEIEARSVLTYGFAEEIVESIGFDPLKKELESLTRRELRNLFEKEG